MAARGRCPECGSGSLVEDAHYAQQQLVCAACGCVLSEGLLTTTYTDEEHLREVAYSQSTGQKEQRSRCLQRGTRRVQDLCRLLQLPAALEETAVGYFQRALQLPAFQLASLERKEVLGGCCVLLTCRQHGWALTMGTLCSLLYARQELFAGVYLSLQKELGLSVPALSLAQLVTTHLNSFQLFQPTSHIPAAFLEDREQLLARTLGLVELASQAWLVTGRHPVPVVTASAFLAWQSLRPGPRLSCPLARFCRLAGVDLPPPAQLRLKELLEVLQGMASQLPWLRGLRLDRRTVVKHVGELLQHRGLLLRKAFSQQDTAPGQGSPGQDSLGQGSPGQDSLDQGSPDQDSPGQDSPCQNSPDKDSLNKNSPGQDPPGQGSQDKDSLDKESPGHNSPGQDSPCQDPVGTDSLDQDSPDKGSLDKNSPGQDPPGQGSQDKDSPGQNSLDQDSLDKGSPGQDPVGLGSLDQDSPGQDTLNKDTLGKNSPDKDSSDKDSPGQNSVGLGSLNKDPLNRNSLDKNSLNKDSLNKNSLNKDPPNKDSADKDSPNKDSLAQNSPAQNSPGQGCPSSVVAQEQGCPPAVKPHGGGSLRPLLPPCLLHPRKRLRVAAPSPPRVTGDEPISDSEIEQYLRGPEEIQAFRKAKGWL